MALGAFVGRNQFPCDFFVVKPASSEELLRTVREAVDAPPERALEQEGKANEPVGSAEQQPHKRG